MNKRELFDNKTECHYANAGPNPCKKCPLIGHVNTAVQKLFLILLFIYIRHFILYIVFYPLMKASRSAFSFSLCVSARPCGPPG